MNFQSVQDRLTAMKRPLLVLFLVGIAIRLVLMPIFSFNIDLTYWMKAFVLIDSGENLYGTDGYYYTPVWGYVIGISDFLAHLFGITEYGTQVPEFYPYTDYDYRISAYVTSIGFNVVVKIPLLLTDIAIGYLLYAFIKRIAGEGKALVGCLLWMLCPLTVLESAVHGMFDNISAMFLLMAFIAAYDRKYIIAGAMYGVAVFTKFFPFFLIFLLIAMVFKREGLTLDAIYKVFSAAAAAVVAILIIELPVLIYGQFWDSMSFLLARLGLSASGMASVPWWVFVIVIGGLLLIVGGAAHYLCRIRPDILRTKFIDLPDDERERTVRNCMAIVAAVMTVAVLVFSVVTSKGMTNVNIVDFFDTLAKRIVLLLSIYTLILEAYVAYRYIFSKRDDDKLLASVFVISSLLIFLWPPSPQYAIVIVPALIIYTTVANQRYLKPFVIFSVCMALYDIMMAGPSAIFSLAVYTDLLSVDALVPSVKLITSYILGSIPTIALVMATFGVASYISLLFLIYKWYTGRRYV